MGVRVRVRVRFAPTGRAIEVVALVSSGAESERPSVVLGEGEARLLGVESPEAYGAVLYLVEEATARSLAYAIRGGALLELLGEGGEVLSSVVADLVVQPGAAEPLLTDAAIDELGVQPVSFSKGLWRHASDPPGRVRSSAQRPRGP